jgi:DNA repair exonuclease SbcCD ATPase subunit
MLAAFDFHEVMYGRQSNILVLDEVDGRMDDDGIDGLINIIKQELASKAETILIVSHRNQMHDVFDKEIKVIKSDNTSRIKQM